jgi:Ca2+-binding EF-hand superfamily protein
MSISLNFNYLNFEVFDDDQNLVVRNRHVRFVITKINFEFLEFEMSLLLQVKLLYETTIVNFENSMRENFD